MSLKPENQIDYIELPTADTGRAKVFYSAVFGWKFQDYGTDYTSFSDGRLAGGFTKECFRRHETYCWCFIPATSKRSKRRSRPAVARS